MPITIELLELLIERHPELSGKPIQQVVFQPPFIMVTLLHQGQVIEVLIEDLPTPG